MKLDLDPAEINAILQLLGQTQTASGLFPLFVKINEQAKAAQEEKPDDL